MTGAGPKRADFPQMANAIRALAMDAVEKANSGHPGMPMGMADVATTLFSEHLKFDAAAPDWPDRDRFVLSAGHGSMLIYSLGFLLGYAGMTLDEIKNFRQLGAKTAGHPEYGHAPAVETTTGPLGQGLGNAVGMALAEAHLNARFGDDVVDHYTYVIAGDGCLMEGISQEAISLAGHLKLRKLIVLWDDNNISIDGPISLSDSTDQLARFAASGWATCRVDGHDTAAVSDAIDQAKSSDKPTLIACRTVIGHGAPKKAGTASAHGSPLGDEEIAGARKALDWPYAPFQIPASILDQWRAVGAQGKETRAAWDKRVSASAHCEAFKTAMSGDYAGALTKAMAVYKKSLIDAPQKVATRKASEMALGVVNDIIKETIGGSADLTGSNNTKTKNIDILSAENYAGRYVHYGIREHGMAAAMNGMALHGGVVPYGGAFMVFTDYCRPSIRLSALMGVRTVYVMTHDSIGLGEDGPTHQPVEHLAALRAIPNLNVYRPCDTVETAECWEMALKTIATPSVITLTRQGLEQARLTQSDENLSARGAYIVAGKNAHDVTLVASGSEVSLALKARDILAKDGVNARVVSAPCFELFAMQPDSYRKDVMGKAPRVGVEAAIRQGWDLFLRRKDGFVGMAGFGASAPAGDLFEHFGITAAAVAAEAKRLIG
ncbi:transketolase [Hyphococcus sp.]|uniref:transketolase n=1 Tax=Hyphococcus sp. TaxID=2038636 RepID=UPI00208738E8|nr:MAG: transketolase [Marinicaulis sp.]